LWVDRDGLWASGLLRKDIDGDRGDIRSRRVSFGLEIDSLGVKPCLVIDKDLSGWVVFGKRKESLSFEIGESERAVDCNGLEARRLKSLIESLDGGRFGRKGDLEVRGLRGGF